MEISTLLKNTKTEIQLWRTKKEFHNQKIPPDLREKIETLTQNYPKGFLCRELNLSPSLFSNRKGNGEKKSKAKKSLKKNPEFLHLPIQGLDLSQNSSAHPKPDGLLAKLNFPGNIEVRIYQGISL